MTSKLVSDISTPDAVALRHAEHMRELFGRMLQVAAGGGGIDVIGKHLILAAQSLREGVYIPS